MSKQLHVRKGEIALLSYTNVLEQAQSWFCYIMFLSYLRACHQLPPLFLFWNCRVFCHKIIEVVVINYPYYAINDAVIIWFHRSSDANRQSFFGGGNIPLINTLNRVERYLKFIFHVVTIFLRSCWRMIATSHASDSPNLSASRTDCTTLLDLVL